MSSRLFSILLILVNIMGVVRYIFKYGEPHTSPEYTQVPSWYFLAWNIMTGLMLLILLYKTPKIFSRAISIYLLVLLFCANIYLQSNTGFVLGYAKSLIMYGFVFLLLLSHNEWLKVNHINKVLDALTITALAFLCWQIIQYNAFGYLPSHSHRGSLIRYGSIWDDSLVFGCLLPMFAGYYYEKFNHSPWSYLTITLLFYFSAFVTGSFTAIGTCLLYSLLKISRFPRLLMTLVATFGLIAISHMSDIIRIIDFKAGSIEGHLAGWSALLNVNASSILGISPTDTFVESGLLMLLINFGAPLLLLILIVHFYTLHACRKLISDNDEIRPFAGATEGLTVSVLFFSINLPVVIISPVYLFVAIFSSLIISRSVTAHPKLMGNLIRLKYAH
ncbi:MAG: hypothetical protein P8171_26215 [Candidatus Thiodiazotropha sp.]